MVKMDFDGKAEYKDAEECLTDQLKDMSTIFYDFDESGYCQLGLEFREADMATPEEFLPIALERFNKFGFVAFEGIDTDNNYINRIRCIDENLTREDFIKMYEKNEKEIKERKEKEKKNED
jgi:hypothetical protein